MWSSFGHPYEGWPQYIPSRGGDLERSHRDLMFPSSSGASGSSMHTFANGEQSNTVSSIFWPNSFNSDNQNREEEGGFKLGKINIQYLHSQEQSEHEHTRYRAYTPFNNCRCTATSVCDYCISRNRVRPITPNYSTSNIYELCKYAMRLSPPNRKIMHLGRLKSIICKLHSSEDSNNYYCYTCSENFCILCQAEKHLYSHEIHTFSNAAERTLEDAVRTFNIAIDIMEIIKKELDNIQESVNEVQVEANAQSMEIRHYFCYKTKNNLDDAKALKACKMSVAHWRRNKMQSFLFSDHQLKTLFDLLRINAGNLYSNIESVTNSVSSLFELIVAKDEVMSHIYRSQKFIKDSLPAYFCTPSVIGNYFPPLNAKFPVGLGKPIPWLDNQVNSHSPVYESMTIDDSHTPNSLYRPWGITCDQYDHILVVDRSHHRVQVFEKNGQLLTMFGNYGKSEGQFNTPAGIAVDRYNRIIVADKDNHRIQIFTLDGIFLHSFGTKGSSFGQFFYPWDVAVNSLCQIAVSDTRNNRVQLFSPHGVFLKKFGCITEKKILDIPRGICFTHNGNLLTCDFNNHRLLEIDSDFKNSRIVVDNSDKTDKRNALKRPQGVAIDDSGNIFIADSRNNQIQVRRSSGKHLTNLHLTPPRFLDRPSDVIVTPRGKVAAVDFGNNRIVIW